MVRRLQITSSAVKSPSPLRQATNDIDPIFRRPALIGRVLSHYRIKAAIGAGGMGEVYRATDTKLGRDVALKVLPAGMASDPERLARFQREARAVAALNNPNIVTVYSVEQADGIHFLTMELVEGQALDQQICVGGLPMDRIMAISNALSEALATAHDKGIVHRDLKPANVMVSDDGRVKVLDFGLAKDVRTDSSTDVTRTSGQTNAGVVMGTPAYMSPEQVAGRAVDHRTDIFSFGIILYEITTGQRPFHGESPAELASSILRDTPRPASALRPELPAHVQSVIEKCLQKDPNARLQSARDVRSALNAATFPRASSGSHAIAEQSIGVLPFKSLSSDADDEFFADGVTEEILNALSQISGLRVPGRSSTFSFKGRSEDLRAVGAKLNVATLLEGTLRRSGDRLRITAQLIDAGSGYQLWSERYDRIMEDVFAVQDEIARTIAGRLRLSLAADQDTQTKPPTRNLEAYELYLKGRALLYQRGLSIPKAIECFKSAVALDPDYAEAWAGLADGYTTCAYSGIKRADEVMPSALEAARRALSLNPELAEAHSAVAAAALLYELDFKLAEQQFLRALELNPKYPQALAWYGLFFLQWISGRTDEAREVLARTVQLDPLSAYANTILAFSHMSSGRSRDAVEYGRKGVECDPNSYLAHWSLMVALAYNSEHEEAVSEAEVALAISGRHTWALTTLVSIYADWGKADKALAVFREAEARSASEYIQPGMLAPAAAAVGDMEKALGYVQQALDMRDPMLAMLARTWPSYARLREEPRFLRMIGRLHLPGWPTSA